MKATRSFLLAAFFCGALPLPLRAGEGATPADAPALPEIVVSASAQAAEAQRIPAHVQVITRREIESLGAKTLDEALERFMPGSSRPQPGALSNIGMRGMSTGASASSVIGDRVTVLIDGMRASTGNPAAIPFALVERIEIVRGPSSVLYGSSAMGGVVNIITVRGKGDMHGKAGASWGRFDTARAEASVSGAVSEKWGMALGAGWGKSHDYKDGSGARYANTAGSNLSLGATATYRNEGAVLHLTGLHRSVYDTGSPGSATWLTPHDRISLHNSRLSSQLEVLTDAGHSVSASLWGEENRYKYAEPQTAFGGGDTRFTTDTLGTRIVGGYSLGAWGTFSLGLDYMHSREKAHGTSVNQPDSLNDFAGIFAEHRFEGERLTTIVGARYDNYHGSLRSNKGVSLEEKSKNYDHVSWSAGATYRILDWLRAKASVGTAFVTPSAVNLAGRYVAYGWYNYVGNPDLKAETSLTGQAGLEFDAGNFHAEALYFQSRYKNRISTIYALDGMGGYYTWTNVPSQRLGGFDLSASWRGTFGGFTVAPYMRAEIFTKRHNPDNSTVTYVPHHSTIAGVGLGWKMLWLDVNARFTGTQWQTSPYSYQTEKMDSFSVVNAKLTVHATKSLDLYCGVNNLSDRQYAFTWGYPMPGRAVYAGFTFRF